MFILRGIHISPSSSRLYRLGVSQAQKKTKESGDAGNAHWAEASPLFAHRARPSPLSCQNDYLVLALKEQTAA